jgi:hypothetical protein
VSVQPGTGDIKTKKEFGDLQLHIEWRTPSEVDPNATGQGVVIAEFFFRNATRFRYSTIIIMSLTQTDRQVPSTNKVFLLLTRVRSQVNGNIMTSSSPRHDLIKRVALSFPDMLR